MATKEMTKEEAQHFVRTTKYCLKNENESANLQKKLLAIGCKWMSGCKEVQNEECKYLFVGVNLNITASSGEEIFIKNKFLEVNVNDVLNIEIKDIRMETLKFKVGDKVRVKSLEWYNSNKDKDGLVYIDKQGIVFGETMANLCGKIVQIEEVNKTGYFICGHPGFFQDWMLDNEMVAEEKQEVKQLNKNDMGTKEMTKEEVFAYLNNTKIMCTSEEESKKVQEKLFELGIKWQETEGLRPYTYLFMIINYYLKFTNDIEGWFRSEKKEIKPSEILAIQVKEEGPKFDPKTLQPFDKVLIRDKEGDKWRCNLFCHINEELMRKYFCVFDNWIYCIPYNEDTKNLVGTTDEAPEFYRI